MKRRWTHVYAWGNNEVRARLKGRRCRLIATGARQTALVEIEGAGLVSTSLRALRRIRT